MKKVAILGCLILILNLGSTAFAKRQSYQTDYTTLFTCIKKLVPSVYNQSLSPLAENYEKARGYLETLAVYGNSAEIVKPLVQYCLSNRSLPEKFLGLATAEQAEKVAGLLADFAKPRMKCVKAGFEITQGLGLAFSAKLVGAKCTTSIGEVWYQVMPGAGLGVGFGLTNGLSVGQHARDGEKASDDSGATGIRVVGSFGFGGSIELNSTSPERPTDTASTGKTPVSGVGLTYGTGAFAIYEGQLSFEMYRGALRVDYLLNRLGVDSSTTTSPEVHLN